jgi:hypothetical protein
MDVLPSNYTPPEPPELREPAPNLGGDDLVRLLGGGIAETAGWQDPATLETRDGFLLVRQQAGWLDAVERTLAACRARLVWSLDVEAEVLELPQAAADALSAAPDLSADDRATIARLLAQGEAKRLERIALSSVLGARSTVRSGTWISYLRDYAVELGEGAEIANPQVGRLFAGTQIDLEAALGVDGDSVQLDVRYDRTAPRLPLDGFSTVHGNLDVPRVGLDRLRASFRAASDHTQVVGRWRAGPGRLRLLLLTPRIR